MIITIIILIILAAVSISAIVGTNMINTAVSGVDNYVEAGEVENQIMENVVDYLDSVVASISKEPQTFTDEEIAELIGKYVDYTPTSGTYKTVTGNSTYTGTDANDNDFTTDTSLHWRIWSIENGTLTLIADDISNGGGYYNTSLEYYTLLLYGNLGYNNGVKILNDICKTCYSNTTLGAIGRSLNVQDIEEILNWDEWKPTDYYNTISGAYYYTYKTLYQYASYTYYPGLWPKEDYSNIDGKKVEASYTYENGKITYTGNGLRRSSQTTFCTDSYGQASKYIEPTQTFWYATADTLLSAWTNSEYANLVNCGKYYWLASRYVKLNGESVITFGLQFVNQDNSVGGYNHFFSNSEEYRTVSVGIRPVVEISLSSVTLDTETTSGDDIANALQLVAR